MTALFIKNSEPNRQRSFGNMIAAVLVTLCFFLALVTFSSTATQHSAISAQAQETNASEPTANTQNDKESMQFKDDHQRAVYNELVAELRCPKCQNQNIADSNAVVAKDMRVKTKQLLDEGYDKEDVIEYMVNRYGQFAHYQPPFNASTFILWILPVVFIFVALIALRRRIANANDVVLTSQPNSQKLSSEQLDSELEDLLAPKASTDSKQEPS